MAKVTRYDIKTDQKEFSISAISKKDMKEYMARHGLYGKKKTFNLYISHRDPKKSDYITDYASVELEWDSSKAGEGIITRIGKPIERETDTIASCDKKRDEIFEAIV